MTETQEEYVVKLLGMQEKLSVPFSVEHIEWKPQATSSDKTRALAVAYADIRAYEDRLNEVCPDWWNTIDWMTFEGKVVCTVTVNVGHVPRTNVGEAPLKNENAATIAYAQAFKRACSSFGLGRYLYDLPRSWVDYDEGRKKIADAALEKLNLMYKRQFGGPVTEGDITVAREMVDRSSATKAPKWPVRPWDIETLRRAMAEKVANYKGKSGAPSEAQLDYCRTSLSKLGLEDSERHAVTLTLFGVESTGDLTAAQCSAIIDWVGAKAETDWKPSQDAKIEARACIRD